MCTKFQVPLGRFDLVGRAWKMIDAVFRGKTVVLGALQTLSNVPVLGQIPGWSLKN